MEEQKIFFKILDELCVEKNIEQKMLSYNWIRELEKENKIRNMINYQFDLNSANSCRIASDKFATYEVLNKNNIPIILHKMLFNPISRGKYYDLKFLEEAKELLELSNNQVVIKANDSCKGKDVYLCKNEYEIEKTVKMLFEQGNDTLSACPYIEIEYEYRVIYLCGEILYVYKKKKPFVVGDGVNCTRELIKLKFSDKSVELDLCDNLDLNYIPQKEENVIISWKHNLNGGAEALFVDENDEFLSTVKDIAISAGKAININFASIDVALTNKKEVLVMEINSSVCMNKFSEIMPNGYEISKQIYSKAIDKMFE